MHKVKFKEWNCLVEKAFYGNNRVALELIHEEDGNPVAVATVNIPEFTCPEGYVFIKDWSENEGIYEALLEAKVIEKWVALIPTGFVNAKMCKLLI